MIDETDKKIIALLQEAYIMGKKISRKLFDYKGGDKEAFLKELNYKHNIDHHEDRKRRRQRKKES